ncbi:60S acidic ribosomal protein P2 [Kwoniella heveanensis CBS 569]|nr:60S acidic ribosomal protein P2 [Kwoniella heveanensis CBS 569]
MKLLAAYLLLQIGGNASPSAADIKALLETVGVEAEEERLSKLISELEGKDINEVSGHCGEPFERSEGGEKGESISGIRAFEVRAGKER